MSGETRVLQFLPLLFSQSFYWKNKLQSKQEFASLLYSWITNGLLKNKQTN